MSAATRTRSERIEALAQLLWTAAEPELRGDRDRWEFPVGSARVTEEVRFRFAEAVFENFEKIEAIIDGTPEDFYPFLRDSGLVE